MNVHPGENEGSITDRNNNNNIYSNYMRSQRTTKLAHNNSNSELIEDLEKIEQYSVNTYLRNDLLEIYGTIDEEFKDFKKGVFNTNLNRFEKKMGEFDNKDELIKKKKRKCKEIEFNYNIIMRKKLFFIIFLIIFKLRLSKDNINNFYNLIKFTNLKKKSEI